MKKALTAVSLLAVLAATGCTQASPDDLGLSLEEKVSVKETPTFNTLEGTPEGWVTTLTAEIPENEKKQAEEHFKKRPAPLRNADSTCTYTQEFASLPSYMNNRSEEFLSEFFLYQQAESNGTLLKEEPSSVGIETSAGKMEFTYGLYNPKINDIRNNTDKNSDGFDTEAVQVHRAVAVRVFDSLIDKDVKVNESAPQPFGSDIAKTLPGVILTYECKTEESFDEEEAKTLFASSRVDIKK